MAKVDVTVTLDDRIRRIAAHQPRNRRVKSLSSSVNEDLRRYYSMLAEDLKDVKAKLSKDEISLLIDGCRKSVISKLWKPKRFRDQVQDAFTRYELGKSHPNVKPAVLLDKLDNLSRGEALALVDWLEGLCVNE